MSFRARSSSSLRALPFSFWAYTSSARGHTHRNTHRRGIVQKDRKTHRGETDWRERTGNGENWNRKPSQCHYISWILQLTKDNYQAKHAGFNLKLDQPNHIKTWALETGESNNLNTSCNLLHTHIQIQQMPETTVSGQAKQTHPNQNWFFHLFH